MKGGLATQITLPFADHSSRVPENIVCGVSVVRTALSNSGVTSRFERGPNPAFRE